MNEGVTYFKLVLPCLHRGAEKKKVKRLLITDVSHVTHKFWLLAHLLNQPC
jgi:hypothetical protein